MSFIFWTHDLQTRNAKKISTGKTEKELQFEYNNNARIGLDARGHLQFSKSEQRTFSTERFHTVAEHSHVGFSERSV